MEQPKKTEPLNAAEILAKGREPRKFLVTQAARPDSGKKPLGVIPENSYTLLVAESGHGKTWISLDLARLMATPQEQRKSPLNWLGMYEIEPRKVLYLDEENGEPLLGERLARLGLSKTADLIVWSRSQLKIDNPKHLVQIIKFCHENKCQVVFLDSLVRFHGCEENDAQAMAFVADSIRTLVAADLTVIVLHHTRKGGGKNEDKLRGSSEITAGADTVLFLENWQSEPDNPLLAGQKPDWNMFTLSASKLRYASKQEFQEHNFRRKEDGDAICFVCDTTTRKWKKRAEPITSGSGNEENRVKPRRTRGTSQETLEEKARRVMPEVLTALQNMTIVGEKADQPSIARKCVVQKEVAVKALSLLESDREIEAIKGKRGALTYALLKQARSAPPPSSEGGAEGG